MPRKKEVSFNEATKEVEHLSRSVWTLWDELTQDKLCRTCPYHFHLATEGPVYNQCPKEPLELTYYVWGDIGDKLWVEMTDEEKALNKTFAKIADEIIKVYKYNGYYLS